MKTKDEYINFLHKKINEWNSDIDRLLAKVERADAETKVELQDRIRMLQTKRDEIEAKIAELGQAGAGAWQDIKSGLDLAWEAMNVAVKSARNRFFK